MLFARNRNGQGATPSGTTAFDDVDATFGTHALAKSVGAFTADFTRLVCTLHDSS